MMDEICVVGGSGFIGTRLVNRLLQTKNFRVKIIDKASSVRFPDLFSLGDIRSPSDLGKIISKNSIIVNLAAEHRDDVRPLTLYDDVNVGGARNLCLIAREKGVNRIIFTSSVAIYGFAPIGTDEFGNPAPFNDYGRTKFEAEQIFKEWQAEAPKERALVIIRPTVVFGEQNRGNVYNLLRQIASGKFVMIGSGENRKSMAYVENVAAFIEFGIGLPAGVHIYNYIDKPDFTMNILVGNVNKILGRSEKINLRLPFTLGYLIAKLFDLTSFVTGRRFSISSIRVKKFCANSVYNTAVDNTDFIAPVPISQAIEKTVRHEFIEKHANEPLFFSE
jgi:GlcNAc-P-P-Und epimerase